MDNFIASENSAGEYRTPLALVVDDDTRIVSLLRAFLESFECESAEALNGVDALKLVALRPPQLILLDIMMPEMGGIEVLRRLKRNTATKDIPVLMLTGQQETTNIEAAFNLGAINYMLKPVMYDQFVNTIKETRTASGYPLRLRATREEGRLGDIV
jgi:CheY-like chemotaxis protein